MDSILNTIKLKLGMTEEETAFDVQIITHINTYLARLATLGVGPVKGFFIEDATAEWDDFIPDDDPRLRMAIDYVYLKVKLVFDPPPSSSAQAAMKEQVDELEWCLNAIVDPGDEVTEVKR